MRAVRVRFAREETERSRKRREASSLHRHSLSARDPWIELDLHDAKASGSVEI